MVARLGFERAIAIEPDPENYRLLVANVYLNNLQDRITCLNLAIGQREGYASFARSDRNSGDHHVLTDGVSNGCEEEAIKVPMATLDAALSDSGVPLETVGVVWLDTQGYEGHILSGAPGLTASDVPIVMEFWPAGLRRAGGVELLQEVLTKSYSGYLDLNQFQLTKQVEVQSLARLPQLFAKYDVASDCADQTDLLLVKPN